MPVLQCRQKPDFEVCGETIGWQRDHPDVAISKHFKNSELEWFTTKRTAIIPYRILIKMESAKISVKCPFGTYNIAKDDIVKCDAEEIWRIGDVVKATTTIDFKERDKVEVNDIGHIKKLMATDKDVLHVDFQGPVGLVEVYPAQIRKCAPGEFFAVGDWVKATKDLDFESGIVKKGTFGMVISPNDPNFGLLVNWTTGGAPATLSNCATERIWVCRRQMRQKS